MHGKTIFEIDGTSPNVLQVYRLAVCAVMHCVQAATDLVHQTTLAAHVSADLTATLEHLQTELTNCAKGWPEESVLTSNRAAVERLRELYREAINLTKETQRAAEQHCELHDQLWQLDECNVDTPTLIDCTRMSMLCTYVTVAATTAERGMKGLNAHLEEAERRALRRAVASN